MGQNTPKTLKDWRQVSIMFYILQDAFEKMQGMITRTWFGDDVEMEPPSKARIQGRHFGAFLANKVLKPLFDFVDGLNEEVNRL